MKFLSWAKMTEAAESRDRTDTNCMTTEQYTMLPDDSAVSLIPDYKWHFLNNTGETLRGNITTATPVLRTCSVFEVFEAYYYKGQPRTELLLLFQHVKGEHLFNLTLANNKFYVNRKFYVRVRWFLTGGRTSVLLQKNKRLSRVWALHDGRQISIGNGNLTTPIIPWVYHSVPNPVPSRSNGRTSYYCSEVKIKVADGYVEYRVAWSATGFPSEPYDDTFFTPTTTTSATTQSQDHTELEITPSETVSNKASLMMGVILAIGGILVMVAAGVLFFAGFRLGQWSAKKVALKQG
uniref:CUB domain-containing protein n=1 Tax=Panagrellus redivivus TaxID=6233 RepID=A0A7E4VP11_PANRE